MQRMRLEVPTHPKFYPPLKGDAWGDGVVEAYGQNIGGTYWVRLRFPNGSVAQLDRCPINAENLTVGRIEWAPGGKRGSYR